MNILYRQGQRASEFFTYRKMIWLQQMKYKKLKEIKKETAVIDISYEKRQIQLATVNNAKKDPGQEKPRKKIKFVVEQLESLL